MASGGPFQPHDSRILRNCPALNLGLLGVTLVSMRRNPGVPPWPTVDPELGSGPLEDYNLQNPQTAPRAPLEDYNAQNPQTAPLAPLEDYNAQNPQTAPLQLLARGSGRLGPENQSLEKWLSRTTNPRIPRPLMLNLLQKKGGNVPRLDPPFLLTPSAPPPFPAHPGKCSPSFQLRRGGAVTPAAGRGRPRRVRMMAAAQPAPPAVSIRPCRPEDCAQVMRLIRELAEFEKVPEQVKISDQELCQDGFCEDPFYKCLVAEIPPEDRSEGGPTVVGYGLYFFTYSTWKGRNIYMEDLYVRPEFRGQGIGKKLMSRIAQMGVERGCTQMKFSVLDWNRSAVDFYCSKGAVDLTAAEDWHVFRFEEDALRRLALGEPGE